MSDNRKILGGPSAVDGFFGDARWIRVRAHARGSPFRERWRKKERETARSCWPVAAIRKRDKIVALGRRKGSSARKKERDRAWCDFLFLVLNAAPRNRRVSSDGRGDFATLSAEFRFVEYSRMEFGSRVLGQARIHRRESNNYFFTCLARRSELLSAYHSEAR
jgi:hypothetical protein